MKSLSSMYDPARSTAAQTGVPTYRTRLRVPEIAAESFTLPGGGVKVDATKMAGFASVLKSVATEIRANPKSARKALTEAGQKLLNLHAAEQKQLTDALARHFDKPHWERWDEQKKAWRREFESDREIGGNRKDTTLARAKALLARYGEDKGMDRHKALLDALGVTGAGDHPEVIRFVDWAGSQLPPRNKRVGS